MRTMIPATRWLLLAVSFATVSDPVNGLLAQENATGIWVQEDDVESGTISVMRLNLHPQAAPKPELSTRLIPNEFDRYDGNAAIYYLKAMGFLEQSYAKEKIMQFIRNAQQKARDEGKDVGDMPPYAWLDTPIAELPIEELKQYLEYSSFQPRYLREAALQKNFELDRHMRTVESPVSYLLPEIQAMRELARKQSLRCRLAVAEERPADAIEILQQQYAMANHLGSDEFLVSALVGAAISGIATTDALQVVQLNDAPNLYWAIAALPDPLIGMQQAYAYERELLFEQIKILKEVDETPRSTAYWQDFVDRFIEQVEGLDGMLGNSRSDRVLGDLDRVQVAGLIAASYLPAVRFLVTECGMKQEQIELLPTTQTVFLAMVRFHQMAVDHYFKWVHIPMWQAEKNAEYQNLDNWLDDQLQIVGWVGTPTGLFFTAVRAARQVQYRCQQSLAQLQTVEALRMYAAEHEGQLPRTLEQISVPLPLDPFSGQPIQYELKGQTAILTTMPVNTIRHRLILNVTD